MKTLRLYHAFLGSLAIAAFVSGEMGLIHAWIGYGVAAVIVFRLGLAATGLTGLGLMRFYPHFDGLRVGNALTHPAISRTLLLAIALLLFGVTGTGLVIDRGRSIGTMSSQTHIRGHGQEPSYFGDDEDDEGEEGLLSEFHETLGNLLILVVGLHVTYLLVFKRPIARYMLFLAAPRRRDDH